MSDDNSLKGRVTRQGEEAIGRLAQELLENPAVSRALSAAFETRERAVRAQEVAMGALNLPSACDLERLTRRVRSVSQRLEGIEDGLDRLEERLGRPTSTQGARGAPGPDRGALARLEAAPAQQPLRPAAATASSRRPRRAPARRAGARPRAASSASIRRRSGSTMSETISAHPARRPRRRARANRVAVSISTASAPSTRHASSAPGSPS